MIDVLDIIAFAVFAVLLVAVVVIVVSLGQLPGRIAHQRSHPHPEEGQHFVENGPKATGGNYRSASSEGPGYRLISRNPPGRAPSEESGKACQKRRGVRE